VIVVLTVTIAAELALAVLTDIMNVALETAVAVMAGVTEAATAGNAQTALTVALVVMNK